MDYKKNKLVRGVTILVLLVPILVSIIGSFFPAEIALSFFTSIWMQIFRIVYFVLFAVGLGFSLGKFKKRVSFWLIHLGCMVVVGAVVYDISSGSYRVGFMKIHEGCGSDSVAFFEDDSVVQLPFSIKLNDFQNNRYDLLRVEDPSGKKSYISSIVGDVSTVKIRESFVDFARIEIIEAFDDLVYEKDSAGQMIQTRGSRVGKEANPAVVVKMELFTNGELVDFFTFPIFQRVPFQYQPDDPVKIYNQWLTREFVSEVEFVDGQKRVEKRITVNHPAYYRGYYFYQKSYDLENETYTVLGVRRMGGTFAVFAGYLLILAGMFVVCAKRRR
ncbi:MAG: cytochrome c biogenesis protein ResB [Spirochaetales bacterium]|nr:cytochrome c biogenesis protein ResB [Spirochaetales bacterium]